MNTNKSKVTIHKFVFSICWTNFYLYYGYFMIILLCINTLETKFSAQYILLSVPFIKIWWLKFTQNLHITVPSPNLAFLCRNLDYKPYSINFFKLTIFFSCYNRYYWSNLYKIWWGCVQLYPGCNWLFSYLSITVGYIFSSYFGIFVDKI